MLPVVTAETINGLNRDLIRAEELSGSGCDLAIERIQTVMKENPGVAKAVHVSLADVCTPSEFNAALLAMAITYNLLKAQAEVNALERLVV